MYVLYVQWLIADTFTLLNLNLLKSVCLLLLLIYLFLHLHFFASLQLFVLCNFGEYFSSFICLNLKVEFCDYWFVKFFLCLCAFLLIHLLFSGTPFVNAKPHQKCWNKLEFEFWALSILSCCCCILCYFFVVAKSFWFWAWATISGHWLFTETFSCPPQAL